MHKKYNGFYLGYVIQNNDPDRAGKVKIYIPTLMPALIEKPDKISEDNDHVKIDFKDLSTIESEIIQKLKYDLPWARQLSPLIGSGCNTIYNNDKHLITTVDNPIHRIDFAERLKSGEIPKKEPAMPGSTLQQISHIIPGGHSIHESETPPATPSTDPDNDKVIPELYSNELKGIFSIPSVGALVWVFFENGEWDLPVYFGYHYGATAWKQIYGAENQNHRGVDYPNKFENNEAGDEDEVEELIREKIIFNSKAGSLSFTGTDYFSKINLSHQQGTFLQMDNTGYKQMIYGKSTIINSGDEFKTTKGDSNNRYNKNYNLICDQSLTIRTGSRRYGVYEKASQIIAKRAAVLANFKINRTAGIVDFTFGTHLATPDHVPRVPNPNLYSRNAREKRAPALYSVPTKTPQQVKAIDNQSSKGMVIPPNTADYDNLKRLGLRGRNKTGLKGGEISPYKVAPVTWNLTQYVKYANIAGWDRRSAGLVRKSRSTAGGAWRVVPGTTIPEVRNKLIEVNKELDEILKLEGDGGDQHIEITKDYFVRVGAVNNTFPAVRVDPIGGIVLAGVVQGDTGPSSIYRETNLVEYTGNDSNFPCGNHTISCGNKFAVDSGAGGIVLKTTGVSEIAGVATKISGLHLIELTTSGNISLDASRSLTITADILSLRQRNNKQIALGGSVGVENNITVGGSAIVNGELYLQHVTAPAEIQTTDQTYNIKGWTHSNQAVGYIPEGRIIVRLTKDLCYKICRHGGVRIRDTDKENNGDEQFEFRGGEPDGEDVLLPAYNDVGGFRLGVKPEYRYDATLDEYVEKPNTGFGSNRNEYTPGKVPDPENPPWGGSGANAVPLQGTDRITAVELETHAHQFKNLPLSLRATPEDVIKEARDVEAYPEVRGIHKGSRPAKILVKKYGESKKAKEINKYLADAKSRILGNNLTQPEITGQGVGNEDDIRRV